MDRLDWMIIQPEIMDRSNDFFHSSIAIDHQSDNLFVRVEQ